MSASMNRALGVESTELKRHLVVVRDAIRVDVDPLYTNLSPPTVIRTLFVSTLFGQTVATSRRYMTLRPFGIFVGWMKNMVSLPRMRLPTPWANLPKSLARDVIHISLSGPLDRAPYSREVPVASSMTAFASNSLCTMWVVAAIYCPCIDSNSVLR